MSWDPSDQRPGFLKKHDIWMSFRTQPLADNCYPEWHRASGVPASVFSTGFSSDPPKGSACCDLVLVSRLSWDLTWKIIENIH